APAMSEGHVSRSVTTLTAPSDRLAVPMATPNTCRSSWYMRHPAGEPSHAAAFAPARVSALHAAFVPRSECVQVDDSLSLTWTSFGGGVTAAPGPLESLVEVRTLAPEPSDEGALPWPRSRSSGDSVPTARSGRARRRRRHPHAVAHTEGAAHAVWSPDGVARRRRARGAPA